jgi:[ribosomal protein S5]-alanine N-acetyltransferase
MEIDAFFQRKPELETERLLLRKIYQEDLDDVFEFSSDPLAAHHMTWEVNRTKEETFRNFVGPAVESGGDFAIILKENDKVIGTCAFISWSDEHKQAEIGFILNRSFWGKGYATEAIERLIQWGFDVLGLMRIEGRCDLSNKLSEKVMKKSGMTYEGTLRKNAWIKGEFRDSKIYSILKEEYREIP